MNKGIRFERELIRNLWDKGFAAVRVAGSGSMSFPSPDVVAGNGKITLAFEVKTRTKLPLYLDEQKIKELVMFSNLFGAKPYIAVKILRKPWVFVDISNLKKTEKGYKIDDDVVISGSSLDEVLGIYSQTKLIDNE